MSRAFITGSSTGLGLMAAQLLVETGHRVVVHGRNQARADAALAAVPGAEAAVVGDLSNIQDMRAVADQGGDGNAPGFGQELAVRAWHLADQVMCPQQ